ncbi:hypothetical protein THAOC_15091 [Thalassiosira oceanica]|uniref:Uncharacterized protein n=1 Tax=Thalassiosira oceanica TaxID=159749 RepID=K0SGX0_THAOC|nr:hypothetical protein THAOC_15091 [Thalassiosira oceanica]|eukprot:EJK64199.1 hypothetical protein THAOC_15091 [Thalassiosira oceanica]
MSAKSLPSHLESQHGIYRSRVIDRDLVLDDLEVMPGGERKAQYAAAAANARAFEVEFTAYGETLERVEVFKYLGRLMAMDDNDMHAARHNLKKARGSGRGFRSFCIGRIFHPGFVGCFTKPSSNRFCFMAARPGRCLTPP